MKRKMEGSPKMKKALRWSLGDNNFVFFFLTLLPSLTKKKKASTESIEMVVDLEVVKNWVWQ